MNKLLRVLNDPPKIPAQHKGVMHLHARKLGFTPRTYAGRQTCPTSCAFWGEGCYAENFHTALVWTKVTDGSDGMSFAELCEWVTKLPYAPWRYGIAGDLPGVGDAIDVKGLRALVAANDGRAGWAYTHKPLDKTRNAEAIAEANGNGFTVNVSTNAPGEVDDVMEMGLPAVTVLPRSVGDWRVLKTQAGRKIVRCPAEYSQMECSRCGAGTPLCARPERDYAIGFTAHGSRAAAADAVCQGGENV